MTILRRFLTAAALVAIAAPHAAAQSTVFVVRHAERADAASGGNSMMASDPDLSEAGRARAAALASMLRSAGVTSIFTTEFKRTQQTAAPLAAALGVQPTVVGSRDTARLLEMVRKAGGTVLVVGHSNTVPEIVKALGVATPVTVADDEFDNLFVVVAGARPTLVRLRYR